MGRSNKPNDAASAELAVATYRRNAAAITDEAVAPPAQKRPRRWAGGKVRGLTGEKGDLRVARVEAEEVLTVAQQCVDALSASLGTLGALRLPRLLGKVEEAQVQTRSAATRVGDARLALADGDFGACGGLASEAFRGLSAVGGPLMLALNTELARAALTREKAAELEANGAARQEAQRAVAEAEHRSPRAALLASSAFHRCTADALALAAEILGRQVPADETVRRPRTSASGDAEVRPIPPQELPTYAEVGGLEEAKAHLRRTVGASLERAGRGGAARVAHNGILLHGPPGTGKTLLARATAGEYGLRFLRFSPAVIASAYQHEPAKKLRQLFAAAADCVPSLLFLDEVDAIAGRREGLVSADHRELATQLLNSLEEYRDMPGLVIMAATNTLDHLDAALREGRFDSRIAIPLPDAAARVAILQVQLSQHGAEVDWDSLDVAALAELTPGRSGAALASIVAGAGQRALARAVSDGHGGGGRVTHADVVAEIEGRSGQDRAQTLEDQISWDDVVLPAAVRERLSEILLVFQRPELGRSLGVRPPAGILLHGPPGTGKTTIARALATEGRASFYEQSAADLLSKWVGESEQKVAQLFARARANRPSIVFCDEIDAVLKRRSADSAAPWEERVVSQFLRELDGLHSGEGVLLVGATNRPDIIDDAVRDRRLVAIEVPLPDEEGRRRLLEVLCRDVRVGTDVDLDELAAATAAMSGADLKSLRNAAGMKALTRAARAGVASGEAAVLREDFVAALAERGTALEPTSRRRPPAAKRPARRRSS